jgi:ribose transport system permease protein
MTSDTLVRLRYRLIPDRLVGEILSKSWVDNAIPALSLVLVVVGITLRFPAFSPPGTFPTSRDRYRKRDSSLSP